MPDYKRLINKRKNALRKKSQLKVKPRRSWRAIFLLFIGVVVIVAIFFSTRYFLVNFSSFEITTVSVVDRNGNALEDAGGIFPLKEHLNLLSLDIKKVVQDIQAEHPEFLSVSIRKHFPHTLVIVVEKRKPIAIVGIRKNYLVDEQGFLLPYESGYRDLPIIIGIRVQHTNLYQESSSLRLSNALKLLRELKKAKVYPQYKLTQMDFRHHSNIILYLEDGVEVKMGMGDFKRKTSLLKRILTQLGASQAQPKYIDMRFEQPTIMPRNK
jgi:cell division septal protein FtsQ